MTDATERAIDQLDGACHCGTVRFHVRLHEGLRHPVRCSCSLCRMRGAVMIRIPKAALTITAGADTLRDYRFHTGAAQHFFCGTCGIYTHHQRRFDTSQFAVNAACLDGISPFDFPEVPVLDGHNHPHDRPGAAPGVFPYMGTVRFDPAG